MVKTSGCALSARCKPYTNSPETQIDKPKQLGEVFPTSSRQLVVNSTPWRPSTFPLGDELSTDLKGHGVELSRTAKIKLRCNVASTVSESTTARVGYADTRRKHTQRYAKRTQAQRYFTHLCLAAINNSLPCCFVALYVI